MIAFSTGWCYGPVLNGSERHCVIEPVLN